MKRVAVIWRQSAPVRKATWNLLMLIFSIFTAIAAGWENWRAFRRYVTGSRWANILTLQAYRTAARFLKKPPDPIMSYRPIQRTLQTFEGISPYGLHWIS